MLEHDDCYFSQLAVLWHSRCDTWTIARNLGLSEQQVERDIHQMLDKEALLRVVTSRTWRGCT